MVWELLNHRKKFGQGGICAVRRLEFFNSFWRWPSENINFLPPHRSPGPDWGRHAIPRGPLDSSQLARDELGIIVGTGGSERQQCGRCGQTLFVQDLA